MKRLIVFALLFVAIIVCLTLIIPATLYSQSELPTTGTVIRNSNLRAGPGTSFAIVGSAKPGQIVTIVEKNDAGDWYHLDSGTWIAAFLVKLGAAQPTADSSSTATSPTTQPVTATVSAPTVTPTPIPPTATPTPSKPGLTLWQDAGVQSCNGFEWRVADVRTAKEVWLGRNKRVAMGQYLVVYTEIKNVATGTTNLQEATRPRVSMGSLDTSSSLYAAWMMTGGYNVPWADYNPGDVITVVATYDVEPNDGHIYALTNCDQVVAMGEWSKIERGVIN